MVLTMKNKNPNISIINTKYITPLLCHSLLYPIYCTLFNINNIKFPLQLQLLMPKKAKKVTQRKNKNCADLTTQKQKQLRSQRIDNINNRAQMKDGSESEEEVKVEGKNMEEVVEHLNYLFQKNKVKPNNAFNLPFIDLNQIELQANDKDEYLWKIISSTLENDYKLYGYRVDYIFSLADKMTKSITRHSQEYQHEEKKKDKKKEGEEVPEEMVNKIQWELDKYMEKNIGNITIFIQSKAFDQMPIFHKLCSKMNMNGIIGMLMEKTKFNSKLELQLFQNQKEDKKQNQQEQIQEQQKQSALPESLIEQIRNIQAKKFNEKIIKQTTKLYENFSIPFAKQHNYHQIWKLIQEKKYDEAFEENHFEVQSQIQRQIQRMYNPKPNTTQPIIEKTKNNQNKSLNSLIQPTTSIRQVIRKVGKVKIQEVQKSLIDTRKMGISDKMRQIIEEQRNTKEDKKQIYSEGIDFNVEQVENSKKILKKEKEYYRQEPQEILYKEKNVKKRRKLKEVLKRQQIFHKHKLTLYPWGTLYPVQRKKQQQMQQEDEESSDQHVSWVMTPSIRSVKEKLKMLILHSEGDANQFAQIYSKYVEKEGKIKKSLCYIALLHLANEEELFFSERGFQNFGIDKN